MGRMVVIILKWMVASIPAILILNIIVFILMMLFGGMLAGIMAMGS